MFAINKNYGLVLASASPRRKRLLASLGLNFRVYSPFHKEAPHEPGEAPEAYARRMAAEKALAAARELGDPAAIVIAADTVVWLDGDIFGKPRDRADALAMLCRLSGRVHRVFTGVEIIFPGRDRISFCEATAVRFGDWPAACLETYLDAAAPFDKAGAYGIQDEGAFLVERIEGSYTNVMGLPLEKVARILFQNRVLVRA